VLNLADHGCAVMSREVDTTKPNARGEEFAVDNDNGYRFFGNSAQFWMNLQTRYEPELARDLSASRIDREVRPHAAA